LRRCKINSTPLPLGKLPAELLNRLLAQSPLDDRRVLLGPGIGLDCAVVDHGGPTLLVYKIEPITFATDEIGWYAIQVSANDIVTTGALPRWYLVNLLLPQGSTTSDLVEQIGEQLHRACRAMGISIIGGHTEITYGLDRPILVGTLIGEVERQRLVTPRGAAPGHRLLLTKGVPIEATAILAREFPARLKGFIEDQELAQAANYLYEPGISVLRDAQVSQQAGKVSAMHDPTEGGLAAALWELAEACGHSLVFDPERVFIPPLSQKICQVFGLDPLATIASGALLLSTPASDAPAILRALQAAGILCTEIGWVEAGNAVVWKQTPQGWEVLPRPKRDEITRVYE